MLAPYFYNQFGVAPGEEHNKYYSNSSPLMESGSSLNSGANNYMGIPPGVEAILPQETSAEMPHQPSQTEIISSEVHEKYKTFKRFDTVNDHGDHFYLLNAPAVKTVAIFKLWTSSFSLYFLSSILSWFLNSHLRPGLSGYSMSGKS
jgi:ubiquitin-conjugating enzyme E2 O